METKFMAYIGGFWEKCKEDLIVYRTVNPDRLKFGLWDFLKGHNFVKCQKNGIIKVNYLTEILLANKIVKGRRNVYFFVFTEE